MKLARLNNEPSALLDFFEEGLEALGAICERTWHDRLEVIAEGPAARLWNPQGSLLDTEIRFVPPGDTAPRRADKEVFPGCPLTFRLAEELRPTPLPLERGAFRTPDSHRPPTLDVAERLWHTQMPGSSRWKIEGTLLASWHCSLVALARCEIQAIDQHWTLHRVALSLPDGQLDEHLAAELGFLQLSPPVQNAPWPPVEPERWQTWLTAALQQELESDLIEIRQRQQKYLRRELERVDAYFSGYESELLTRHRRSHAEGTKIKAEERLAAARNEHVRRREDQIHRHGIRVITHLDALLLLAEPAWQTSISFVQKGEPKLASALFVPRARRWVVKS